MVRPVVLHSSEIGQARELGIGLAKALGIEFEEFGDSVEGFDARVGNSVGAVYLVPSAMMLDRARRVRCLSLGTVVWVKGGGPLAGLEGGECGCRVGAEGLLRVTALLGREFGEAHAVVDGAAVGERKVLQSLIDLVRREPVAVAADERSYLVEVGRGILERSLAAHEFGAPVALYITDENVDRLHGERLRRAAAATGMRIESVVLRPGEESKCMSTLGLICDRALAGGIDRSCWVIAAGGGVVTDISGLVAALWMRGLRWVGVPTTLLSMVDASVGGKTAIDHGMGKNAVGAFWQPSLVVCDVDWLVTESDRNYLGALAEVVKTALIGDPSLFEVLENESERLRARDLDLLTEVVRRCVQVKALVVGLDERESGLRATLNLGHTVGHALEALGEYKRYTHGEAVSLGLIAALELGERLGHSPRALVARVTGLLRKLGLPVTLPKEEVVLASELLGHDKKRSGSSMKFVFVRGVGEVLSERVMLEDLRGWVRGLGSG